MKKKLLIFGKSHHFIKLLKSIYTNYEIHITSWRKPKLFNKFDIVFVCGFDYSSFGKNLNDFLNINCTKPINYLKKITTVDSKVIYINTKSNFKKFTLSRYYFAKVQFANEVNKKFKYTSIIFLPTISNNAWPFIFGNYISKQIFCKLITLGFFKNIELNDLKKILYIKNIKFFNYKRLELNGMLLKIPRSLFFDRLLRFVIG